jgi:hypothetical protein
MASTYFRIKKHSTVGMPAEPVIDAWPVGIAPNGIEAPPVVVYPGPTSIALNGAPAGAFGKPWAEIGRPRINATGRAIYENLFADTSVGSALVKVRLLEPRSNAWTIYSGIAWRPTAAPRVLPGVSGPEYTDFRVRITELTGLDGWD